MRIDCSSRSPGTRLAEVPLSPERIYKVGEEVVIAVSSGRGLARVVLSAEDCRILASALAGKVEL